MPEISRTPSIAVTIGGQERVYHAFVTTAAPSLDGPSTMTLHTSTWADIKGFAADPITRNDASRTVPARLVLIDTRELAWHRARYRAARCVCAPVDPVLVSLRTLQTWLWQRLQAPRSREALA